MKTGRSLNSLAAELTRQMESKKDFVATTNALVMEPDASHIAGLNGHDLGITTHAHGQIADRLQIPKKYYDRMRSDAPVLLANNVNHWFNKSPERRMLRTMDGRVRAFLSDRYRPIDNFDLAEAILPKLINIGCRIESCELTERRMYIKAVTDRLQGDVKVGDTVQAGLVVSNSEVGAGGVKVDPLMLRLVCMNGMIQPDYGIHKYHIGKQADTQDQIQFLRQETIQADNKAFFMKVTDVVDGVLTEKTFLMMLNGMKAATEAKMDKRPDKVVEEVTKRFSLNESESTGVLNHLIEGGDLSKYGLLNAVTRTSQDVADYDRATELERLGGQIMELKPSEWKVLAA